MPRIWINRVTNEIVSNRIFGQWRLKLHDERMIAVQEEFDLHLESYQRGVTGGMRVSWNFLLTRREVNLAKEISVQQKAPRNVSCRYALNSYAERFNVEKCPMRCESTGKGRATTVRVFNASTEQQKVLVDRQENCSELTGQV